MKPFAVGDIVLKSTITKRYGEHAARALLGAGLIDPIGTIVPGAQKKYRVKLLFPEDVKTFVRKHFEVPFADALQNVSFPGMY